MGYNNSYDMGYSEYGVYEKIDDQAIANALQEQGLYTPP